jgi:hypothetical protein
MISARTSGAKVLQLPAPLSMIDRHLDRLVARRPKCLRLFPMILIGRLIISAGYMVAIVY